MANRIDLVRHPDKEGDREGVYRGADAKITEQGWREAEVVIERLVSFPHERIVSSEIPRAKALAELYARRLGYERIDHLAFLNEIDKPKFLVGLERTDPIHVEVMQTIRDCFDSGKLPMLSDRLRDDIRHRLGLDLPPCIKVKGRAEVEAETAIAFKAFRAYTESSILVVCHAKRIASYVHWVYKNCRTLEGFYGEADQNLTIDTTGITTLLWKRDRRTGEMRWHVGAVNDTAHYEAAKNREFEQLVKALA